MKGHFLRQILSVCTLVCPYLCQFAKFGPRIPYQSVTPVCPYLCPSTQFDPRMRPYQPVTLFASTFVHLHSLTPEWDPISLWPCLPLPLSIYTVWPQNGTLSVCTPVCPYLYSSTQFDLRMAPYQSVPLFAPTFVHQQSLTPEWDLISLYPCLPLPLSIYTVWPQNGTLSVCTPVCPYLCPSTQFDPRIGPYQSVTPVCPYLCPSTQFDPRMGPYQSVPLFVPTFVHRHSLTPEWDPISLWPLFATTFVHLHSLTPEWDPISLYPFAPYFCPSTQFDPRMGPYKSVPLFALPLSIYKVWPQNWTL